MAMITITRPERNQPERRYSAMLEAIVNTVELVLVALILAFVFRSFIAEAFQIPTGSMAETLRGDHYNLRCERCGYKYAFGNDTSMVGRPRCPNCAHVYAEGPEALMSSGDRIFVLKSIYEFSQPRRWDVVVFKNPLNPRENYIKRMIATPGETLELIDGDVYIDGRIARKPPKVQDELWMVVYDNDYQPFNVGRQGGDEQWSQPFRNGADSQWDMNAKGTSVFGLDSDGDKINTLEYVDVSGNDFRARYGYNSGNEYGIWPICSDLMIRFNVAFRSGEGLVGAVLKKYRTYYLASLSFDGEMVIEKMVEGQAHELGRRKIHNFDIGRAGEFRFANVDHQLILEFAGEKLKCDLGREFGDVGKSETGERPGVRIFGAGKLRLWHVGIYRDIYYISDGILRAKQGNPFTLKDDEFFVCGDNSPHSVDGRLWAIDGIGSNGMRYTMGTVPRDYLVGKAFFLYWSQAFRPLPGFLPIIPNVSRLQAIYGSSDKEL